MMKQIGKTKDKELVQLFKDQIYYESRYATGGPVSYIVHYVVAKEEVASVSYNFDKETYILRIAQ